MPDPGDQLNGVVLGYDPGGNCKHGVARIELQAGRIMSGGIATGTANSTEDSLQWLLPKVCPLGLGIDTLTAWSTGQSGDRPADVYLRAQYPRARLSVVCPNSLYSSMTINGMAVVLSLRKKWPDVVVSETHPKVLYHALSGRVYDWRRDRGSMTNMLSERIGCDVPELQSDHEWDALISAFAIWQGLKGNWSTDLLQLPVGAGDRLLYPAGRTHYFWPARLLGFGE